MIKTHMHSAVMTTCAFLVH